MACSDIHWQAFLRLGSPPPKVGHGYGPKKAGKSLFCFGRTSLDWVLSPKGPNALTIQSLGSKFPPSLRSSFSATLNILSRMKEVCFVSELSGFFVRLPLSTLTGFFLTLPPAASFTRKGIFTDTLLLTRFLSPHMGVRAPNTFPSLLMFVPTPFSLTLLFPFLPFPFPSSVLFL